MPQLDDQNILHLLDEQIGPGESKIINLLSANLYTNTKVKVPVIVERSNLPGPVVLITSGIHGDEFNGVEIVRQFISKKLNKPKKGTIICIPILNIFGFLKMDRYFPDGRDLNRSFPGFKKGSLASRFAYRFTHEILPVATLCMDFHTGGARRFNAPQIRISKGDKESLKYAQIFNAPFTVYSKLLKNSYRSICVKNSIPYIIFEGGMTEDNNKEIALQGVQGIMRVLKSLDMLEDQFKIKPAEKTTLFITKTHWIRANYSGLIHHKTTIGGVIKKGEHVATITDPYGSFKHLIKAKQEGYVININKGPLVFEGDAILNVSQKVEE